MQVIHINYCWVGHNLVQWSTKREHWIIYGFLWTVIYALYRPKKVACDNSCCFNEIVHGKNERMQFYIGRFTLVVVQVKGFGEDLKCWIFENGLLRGHPFRLKIWRKKVRTTQDLLSESVLHDLGGKLNTQFNNLDSTLWDNAWLLLLLFYLIKLYSIHLKCRIKLISFKYNT